MQWLPCSTLPAQLANQQRALPARRTHKRRTLQQRHRRRLQEEQGITHKSSRTRTPSPGHTLLRITASLFFETIAHATQRERSPSSSSSRKPLSPHFHPIEDTYNLRGLRSPGKDCIFFPFFIFFSFNLDSWHNSRAI